MAQSAPTYDLLLLLALGATDEQRAKVLADVEKAISAAGGSVERNDDWGRRPTAFPIDHQAEAEYHLLQFKAPASIIEELSHTLRITDGVLRFRVIKLRPGTPQAPSSPPPVVAAATVPSGAGPGAATATAPAPSATTAATATPASATAPAATAPASPAAEEPVTASTAEEDGSGADAATGDAEPSE